MVSFRTNNFDIVKITKNWPLKMKSLNNLFLLVDVTHDKTIYIKAGYRVSILLYLSTSCSFILVMKIDFDHYYIPTLAC